MNSEYTSIDRKNHVKYYIRSDLQKALKSSD